MISTITLAVSITIIGFGFKAATCVARSLETGDFQIIHGCRGPKNVSGTGLAAIWDGIRRIIRIISIDRSGEDILDDFFAPSFQGAHTIQETSFDGSIVLSTSEPENMQTILATRFQVCVAVDSHEHSVLTCSKDFEIGRTRINQFYPLLGTSIFSSDGSAWKEARKMFRPHFTRSNLNDLESTARATAQLMGAIGSVTSDGWTDPVKLQPLFYRLTLDTATEFLFGESIESQSLPAPPPHMDMRHGLTTAQARSQQFLDDFELVNLYLIKRIRYQMLYWLADGWQFRRATSRLHAFTERFVQKAIAQLQRDDHHADCGLLSALAFGTPDRARLRNQTMAILAAARDTTAGFLGWCFVRLALHQDVFDELRHAVLRTFGGPQHLDFERLNHCAPLQRFLKEVLRLHPPVPVNNRRAKVDTQLPTGGGAHGDAPVAVRKGQVVIYSVYLMHRRADLWGEDAADFRPGRWVHDVPAWQYLPFSGGPRACLGQQFALAEASYVVARLAMEYDAIRPVNTLDMSRLRKGLGLTMWPADGVPVQLHRA